MINDVGHDWTNFRRYLSVFGWRISTDVGAAKNISNYHNCVHDRKLVDLEKEFWKIGTKHIHFVSFKHTTPCNYTIKFECRDMHDLIKHCTEVEDWFEHEKNPTHVM